jgi:hypothetical protein
MELSESQKAELLKKLDSLPLRPCAVCGHNEWSLTDKVFEIREFFGGSMVIGGGSLAPILMVTCQHCGNTLLFNAIQLGLVQPEQKQSKDG